MMMMESSGSQHDFACQSTVAMSGNTFFFFLMPESGGATGIYAELKLNILQCII